MSQAWCRRRKSANYSWNRSIPSTSCAFCFPVNTLIAHMSIRSDVPGMKHDKTVHIDLAIDIVQGLFAIEEETEGMHCVLLD